MINFCVRRAPTQELRKMVGAFGAGGNFYKVGAGSWAGSKSGKKHDEFNFYTYLITQNNYHIYAIVIIIFYSLKHLNF